MGLHYGRRRQLPYWSLGVALLPWELLLYCSPARITMWAGNFRRVIAVGIATAQPVYISLD